MKQSQNDFAAPEAEHEADPDYNAKDHPAHGCRHEHVEFEPNLKRWMNISDCLHTLTAFKLWTQSPFSKHYPNQVHLLHKSFTRIPHSGGFCKLSHLGNVQLRIILASDGSERVKVENYCSGQRRIGITPTPLFFGFWVVLQDLSSGHCEVQNHAVQSPFPTKDFILRGMAPIKIWVHPISFYGTQVLSLPCFKKKMYNINHHFYLSLNLHSNKCFKC